MRPHVHIVAAHVEATTRSVIETALYWHRLLRRALDALTMRVAIFLILVHNHTISTSSPAEALGTSGVGIDILEVGQLAHRLVGGDVDDRWGREKLAELLKDGRILCPALLGELDVEPDVEVSES